MTGIAQCSSSGFAHIDQPGIRWVHAIIDPDQYTFIISEVGNFYPAIEREGITGSGQFLLGEDLIGTGALAFKLVVVKTGHAKLHDRYIPFFIQRHTI
jgi:hypothetical protein